MRKRRRFRVLLAFLLVMSLVGSGTTPAMVSAEEIVHDHEHEEVLEAPEVQEPEVHVHEWSVEYAQDDASHWRTCIGCGTGEEPAGHSWLDGACTVCGRSCTHNWSNLNGVCAVCGYQCTHDWSNLNGVCAVCQYPCVHDWSNANGVCAVCQYACAHSWNEGVCSVCGTVCGHAWDGNACTVCGSEAPQDDQSGQDAGNDGTGNMDTGDVDTGEEDGDADDDSIAEITPDPDDTNEPEPSGKDDLDTEEFSAQNGAETEDEPVPSLASNGDASLLSEECEHVWASWWSADDTSHWHECQYCDARTDEGAHDWVERSDENSHWEECTGCGAYKDGTSSGHYWDEGVCRICGYVCGHDGYSIGECFICGMYLGEHTHTFDWNWEYDNEYHWHSCFYCDEIINYRGHDWANGVCKTCGYACMHDYKYSGICKNCGMDRAEAHEYYWDIYTTGHQWYCRDCNQGGYWEEHDWNEAGICAVCGYQCGHDGEETGTCDT